jgi:hypothetical protein
MGLRNFQLPGSRRRTINLQLQPWIQLRLPLVVFAITAAFSVLFAANFHQAYGKLLDIGIEQPWLRELMAQQTRNVLVVSLAIGVGYVGTVLVACLAYGHRLLGPLVPIRRQIEAMKNGDYASRVDLRKGDLFNEIAGDLNELAQLLRDQEKRVLAAEDRR